MRPYPRSANFDGLGVSSCAFWADTPGRSVFMIAALCLAAAVAAEPTVTVQPGTARPGDAVLVTVRGVDQAPTGKLGDETLTFEPYEKTYQALVGLPVEAKPQTVELSLQLVISGAAQAFVTTLDVVEPEFQRDELKVANKFVSPTKAAKKRMAADQKAFDEVWALPIKPRQFAADFVWPRISRITAPFGDLRLYNGKKQSQHFGTDLDGEVGDDAFAANSGTVVMARDCYGSGNTVLVQHGLGLVSAYFHLSRIDVKAGQHVEQGDRLGLIGKTGRVTGPHLHFGTKLSGRWVDPESVLRLQFDSR